MPATDLEQLMLEYINDARLDPIGDISRIIDGVEPLHSSDPDIEGAITAFGVNGTAAYNQFTALIPIQPLAWNDILATSARAHNALMIANDHQSHQEPGELDLGNRTTAAGYTWNAVGENVYAYSKTVIYGHAGLFIDWGSGNFTANGMQTPPGHRNNIMGRLADGNLTGYREIGIGITAEGNVSTGVGPLVVTEDFGNRSGLGPIILGVAYTDSDLDEFYSVGEGLGNLTVAVAGSGNVTSAASGGYTIETTAGNKTVTLSGAGLSGNVTVTTTLVANQNIKLDVINGNELHTSNSISVSGPVSQILGLGTVGLTLTGTGATVRQFYGSKGNDTITGGTGGDGIDGREGNDILNGGSGNVSDSLNGGPGIDTAVFSGNRSGYTITHTGPGITIAGADGSDTLNEVEKAQFADMTVNLGQGLKATDFNTDLNADILWQNSDGTPASWWMTGTTLSGGGVMGTNPGTTWQVKGAADFNTDGATDILWQNGNGTPVIWFMNGTTLTSGGVAGFNPGSAWKVIGAGDFDGNGKADILWQNTDGTPAVWLMDGTTLVSGAVLANPGSSWHAIAASDFDSDGKSDILWQNTSGQAAIWLMSSTTVVGGGLAGLNPGSTWHVRTAGSFYDDGGTDILWQNDSGAVALWRMNDTVMIHGEVLGTNPGTSWQIMGAGDFNADGKADILWRNTDGTPAIWLMNGTVLLSGATLANPGTSWSMITMST